MLTPENQPGATQHGAPQDSSPKQSNSDSLDDPRPANFYPPIKDSNEAVSHHAPSGDAELSDLLAPGELSYSTEDKVFLVSWEKGFQQLLERCNEEAMSGRFDRARATCEEALTMVRQLDESPSFSAWAAPFRQAVHEYVALLDALTS